MAEIKGDIIIPDLAWVYEGSHRGLTGGVRITLAEDKPTESDEPKAAQAAPITKRIPGDFEIEIIVNFYEDGRPQAVYVKADINPRLVAILDGFVTLVSDLLQRGETTEQLLEMPVYGTCKQILEELHAATVLRHTALQSAATHSPAT